MWLRLCFVSDFMVQAKEWVNLLVEVIELDEELDVMTPAKLNINMQFP
jgi:hypothetical protein